MSETGTRDNLFFSCSISSYIWSLCKIKLGLRADHIGTLADERMIIQTRFKRKDKVAALARLSTELQSVTFGRRGMLRFFKAFQGTK